MKICISNPRYGSTHVSQHFDSLNRQIHKTFEFEGFNEFLLDAPHSNELFKMSLDERIQFIENKRSQGYEVLFKIHSHHLFYPYQGGVVYDWFKEFYKDAEVTVLKRRDMWRAFLSMLVHYQLGRKLWHKKSEADEEALKDACSKIDLKFNQKVLDNFFYQRNCLNKIKGNVIYLEDTHYNTSNIPWQVSYESLFEQKELYYIKDRYLHYDMY